MAKIKFRRVKLSQANKERLEIINGIIEEYQEQNLVLSLRQLYYQLVSRDIIPNKQSEYGKLSTLLKEGRMGGIVDWDAIEDRLRQPYTPNEFDNVKDGMETLYSAYRRKRQTGQENYIEVWVEKDALSGVLKRVTSVYHVPILVNRGYSSASAMYDSYCRFKEAIENDKRCVILYLGDFDPSGQDMIRDIKHRTREFFISYWLDNIEPEEEKEYTTEQRGAAFAIWFKRHFEIVPIALTKAQINRYKPPPNPAKRTDPRAKEFIREHGGTSWEVDALRPEVLNNLLVKEIEKRLDMDQFRLMRSKEDADKESLQEMIDDLPDDE